MHNTVTQTNALEFLRTIPDNSIDLIATDPPYFQAIDEAWDRQWNNASHFLDWLGTILDEMARVLKLNGSLYMFASPKMATKVESEIDRRFRVLNRIIWVKGVGPNRAGPWGKANPGNLRRFHPRTEHIIFAESRLAAHSESVQRDRLRAEMFMPLIDYFQAAKQKSGLNGPQICERMHELTGVKFSFERHTLAPGSQWAFPTESAYKAAQSFLSLPRDYEDLRREYEALRYEYELDRRHFDVIKKRHLHTDVWEFPHLGAGDKRRKHPTQKPLDLMMHIIRTSSREGDVVLDPFCGSGSTLVAAKALGRRWLGCDMDKRYVAISKARLGEPVEIDEIGEEQTAQRRLF